MYSSMEKIVLASGSPRRKELLQKAGYQIEIFPPKLSETLDKNLSLDDALVDIARQKADACLAQFSGQFSLDLPVLASDTMVIFGGEALGKPKDRTQAKDFISMLSGQEHEVKTSILLKNFSTGRELTHVETTKVYFKKLTEKEIEDFLDTNEWTDKAGAYGIQGAAGKFVEKLDGSLDSVIGLPVEQVARLLESF